MSSDISQQNIVRHADAAEVEMVPGVFRRTLGETPQVQIVEVRGLAGAEVPTHSHPHHQVGMCVSGAIDLTIAGVLHHCKPGDSWAIPGGVVHSAVFPVETVVVDCFSPPREDYR